MQQELWYEGFGQITWTSDSEETALEKMGQKPEVTSDVTLSFSDISASAGDRDAVVSAPLFLSPRGRKLSMLAGIDSRESPWFFLERKILELQPSPQDGLAISFSSLADSSDPFPASSNGQTRAFPCTPSFPSTHLPTLSLYILTSALPL